MIHKADTSYHDPWMRVNRTLQVTMERATAAKRKPGQPKQSEPKPKRQEQAADGRILDKRWDGRDTFNVPEVAEILGIAPWCAWHAVWKKEIPSIKIGGRVLVPRLALVRLLTVA